MSQLLINDYLKQLDLIKKVSGSQRETTLRGVPPETWAYRLGNLFADHKKKVFDLLARVTTVSVETVRITEAMKGAAR
jgi:hypothetical protein